MSKTLTDKETARARAMQQGEDAARSIASRLGGFLTEAEAAAFFLGFARYGVTLRAAAIVSQKEPYLEQGDPAFAEARDALTKEGLSHLSRVFSGAALDPDNLTGIAA